MILSKTSRQTLGRIESDILIDTIKAVREEAGISQRAVARAMGYTETIYGKIERGERVLDVVEFVDVARGLGMDTLELMGRYVVALQKAKVAKEGKKKGG